MKRNNYILTLLLILSFSFIGMSQGSSRSGSKSFFSKQVSVNRKAIEKNLKYAEQIFEDSISKAVKLVETNLLLAIKNQYNKEEALGYQILGRFNYSLSNYSLSCSNFEKALNIIKNQKNESWYLETLQEAALSFEKKKELTKAIYYYKQANKIADNNNNLDQALHNLWKVGELESLDNQLIKSKISFNSLLERAIENRKEVYQIKAKIGLGKIEIEEGDFLSAQSSLELAQQLAESKEQDALANRAFDLLTALYEKQEKVNKSISTQKQAYLYNNSRGNINSALNNSTNISQNYLKQGRNQEAIDLIEETKPLLKFEDNTVIKREFINTLSKVYEKEGLEIKSEQAKKRYEVLVDSFNYSKQQQKLIGEAKNEFLLNVENKMLLMDKDRELNEQTIELLKKDQDIQNETIKRQKTITTLLILGLSIILILSFLLLKNNRQRQKNNKLLMLKSLRTEMNPHFIFNSLNSVNSFIAKKDEKSANKYLAEFSKLMREVLEFSQEDFIPLNKEIQLLKRYLKLEHFRFNNDFDYSFEVDEKIVLDDYQIPPMLLQPFVENAIWHGLRYKEGKGSLNILFSKESNYLKIIISDDGIGRKHSIKSKTVNQKKMKSTGIKNVENRLEIIKSVFKKELVIDIRNLNIKNESGTEVEIKLY